MLTDKPTAQIFAHRANGFGFRENTLPGFAAANGAPICGVELDVWMSRDKVPVLHHDPAVSVNGKSRHLTSLNKAMMPDFIPTLGEALAAMPDLDTINVELKPSRADFSGVVPLIRDVRFCMSSFYWPVLTWLRNDLPDARLALLLGRATRLGSALRRAESLGAEAIHLSMRQLSTSWVARIRKHGLDIRVYTANTEKDWRRCTDLGVDAIMTDRPLALHSWLQNT